MTVEIPFRREFSFEYGRLERLAPGIRRIVARNPGPFTFRGTGTYVVGDGEVAVIDPGPDLDDHVAALLARPRRRADNPHRDHPHPSRPFPGRGARSRRRPPRRPRASARMPAASAAIPALEAGGDWDFSPDVTVQDGDTIAGEGWRFEAVHTPGHTSVHLCFALPDKGVLFSGDHVMGWSTSVIAPPDGNMGDLYGLARQIARRAATRSIGRPTARRSPSRITMSAPLSPIAATARPASSPASTPAPSGSRQSSTGSMSGCSRGCACAAGRSVHAHLLDLAARGIVASDGPATIEARYRRVRR